MKLSEKLDRLRRAAPKHHSSGMMYATKDELRHRYKRVTLYTLFISSENTQLIRNHVFEASDGRTADGWAEWFRENLQRIQVDSILPGLTIRTGGSKQWAVKRILGFVGDAKYKARAAKVVARRHKTKRQRK